MALLEVLAVNLAAMVTGAAGKQDGRSMHPELWSPRLLHVSLTTQLTVTLYLYQRRLGSEYQEVFLDIKKKYIVGTV